MGIEFIEINPNNYKNYLGLDIVAFSYAVGGAMGEGAGVEIVTKEGEWYHINYVRHDSRYDLLFEIIPPLNGCFFRTFGYGSTVPAGWAYISLECGNHLVVRAEIYEAFCEKSKNDTGLGDLYNHWKTYILEILEESHTEDN